MLPATKAIPKEMLPVVDTPLIQHVVNEAAASGITEIVLVTHASKNAIENHFDTSFELEAQLEKRLKRSLLEEVRSITPPGLTVISVRQAEAKGLGHAILSARAILGDEPVAVMLPDVLIDGHDCNLAKDNLAAMLANYQKTGNSQVMVEPVPWERVNQYGVVDCGGVEMKEGDTSVINNLVEKPAAELAPSNLAVVGRYILSEKIWSLLETTQPGAGGEIQLTDAIARLHTSEQVDAYHLVGRSHDCGDKLGYMNACMTYALRDPAIAEGFAELIVDKAKELQGA
jgi:UTP--glucose-1-phosphate uridylyltransferase